MRLTLLDAQGAQFVSVRPANGVVTGCVAMMQCRVHGEGDTIAGCS
jgi:hypothetical protein